MRNHDQNASDLTAMAKTSRLAGHTLRSEGAPHNEHGQWTYPYRRTGPGRALCSCGELSEVLPSPAARQRWHRSHKDTLRADPR